MSRRSQPIRWDIGSAGILPAVFDPGEENRRPLLHRDKQDAGATKNCCRLQ